METFLVLNGAEVDAQVGDQERVMLDLATGRIDKSQLTDWLRQQLKLSRNLCPSNASDQQPGRASRAPVRCNASLDGSMAYFAGVISPRTFVRTTTASYRVASRANDRRLFGGWLVSTTGT